MSITQAALLTAVGYQYKRALTVKQSDTYEAIQYIADDIAASMQDFRGLEVKSSTVALTQNQAYVDVSSALSTQRDNQIRKVILTNSDDHDDDAPLEEKDYLEYYLNLVPDPTNPGAGLDYDLPEIYARYGDNLFLYPIPDLDSLYVTLYFNKVHPTISSSQDCLYPADFKQLIVTGVLAILFDGVGRKDGTPNDRWQKYMILKDEKIMKYESKPNLKRRTKCNW